MRRRWYPNRCWWCRKTLKAVYLRRDDGKPLCRFCADTRDVCLYCNRNMRVHGRTPDGDAVCSTCYKIHHQPKRRCTRCDELAAIHAYTDQGEPLCARCYRHTRRAAGSNVTTSTNIADRPEHRADAGEQR